jgi:hypothetical protein
MSKAIITMTDKPDGIDVRLEFDPPASVDGRVSGAQWLAGEMLKVAGKIIEQTYEDEGGAA